MRQIASKVTTSTPTSKDENTPSFEGKKKSSKLTVIIVVIIILIGLAAIIRFNVGNLTEKYLRSLLENIPIVNNILPPLDKEIDKYSNYSKEKLLKELNTLKNQLESKDEQLLSYQNTFERLEAEIKRLREIEEQQIQFKIEKNEFSKMVAQEDPKAFIEFFKTFYPETATEIYKELIIEEFRTQEIKRYAEPFQTMDPASAAKVVEEMLVTDMDLVVLIFNNIDSEQQAAIIEEMNPERAARLVKSLAPQ